VTLYDFPGLLSHLIAFQLLLWGVVVAVLAGVRALLVRGQPGRGHWARAILAGVSLPIAASFALAALAELTDEQRFLDRFGAPALAAAAVLGGAWLAARLGHRGRARARAAAETPAAPQPPDAAR